MKNLVSIASLILAMTMITSLAQASDLSQDLKTPFDVFSNPFNGVSAKPLPEATATHLRNLLSACAVRPVDFKLGYERDWDSKLKNNCLTALQPNYEKNEKGEDEIKNMVRINFGDLQMYAVTWDGSNSDGGDEQAIGIYDLSGNRIAVYPEIYSAEGNIIDGLSRALQVQVTKIVNQ